MDAIGYTNEAHFVDSFQKFVELRNSEETCDISILTSNNKIKAHKLVLSAASEYFKNAIYGLFLKDTSKNELKLNEIQYEILSVIIDYIYTGRIEICSENVHDIYIAADFCLLNFVKMMCLEFLLENLNAENCVKMWIEANNYNYENLRLAAANKFFSNLEIASETKEFLNLSKEELSDLLGLRPKDTLFDSIISTALKWAADKENWEDTFIKIFKDASFTRISDDYLENVLSNNELIQSSCSCNKWIANIYKEKSKSYKLQQEKSEAELRYTRFLLDQPIIFMNCGPHSYINLFKYNRRDSALIPFNSVEDENNAQDCKTYNKWIYVLGANYCKRFAFDNPNNGYESVFDHSHGITVKAAVLNNSMYIFGGASTPNKASCIDLNTNKSTSFSLLHQRIWPGVAVNDGSIYICGGWKTNAVERFDPREGGTTQFGSIFFYQTSFTYAAALPNQIYCSHFNACKMMDLRMNSKWVEIKPPAKDGAVQCLFSSYGKLCTVNNNIIYEYNNPSESWNILGRLPELRYDLFATSFE